MRTWIGWMTAAVLMASSSCSGSGPSGRGGDQGTSDAERRLARFAEVSLTADLSRLSEARRTMLRHLIEAARVMDDLFWVQAYGDREALLARIEDPAVRQLVGIHYGPWDRLDGNAPFVPGVGPKPPGANFYPPDLTRAEFEAAASSNPKLRELTTMVRRAEDGTLRAIPYSEFFAEGVQKAAAALEKAAALAEDDGFRRYLLARAEALRTDRYRESDLAWMDMKTNVLDVVIGPIETYEDRWFGLKAAFEAYVLIKDLDWSRRLSRYVELLPELQRGLPVPDAYKREMPGADSDLNVYDAVYYAGDCNAGSKTIAINLPNDEEVQLRKGTRRLQLKNAIQAKFDKILLPIARELIAQDQLDHVVFEAFFNNTMFHEVAHGLGVKHTLKDGTPVRRALQDTASVIEEGKADVLGLYMVDQLLDRGEIADADRDDHYVTFMASIFRSIRFGASSAHGRANLVRFQFFRERGAFQRDEATGRYRVRPERLAEAAAALSEKLLRLQGDGDLQAVRAFLKRYEVMDDDLKSDLSVLEHRGIPVDIVFRQGPDVLGL